MIEHIDTVREWVRSLRQDVETLKAAVETDAVDEDARKFAAAALNYIVSRMDLIPDWTETIGIVDDVLVLRVCVGLAAAHDFDRGLEGDTLVEVGRLMNDAERVEGILGAELYPEFRRYCARLSDEAVRGRVPETIVKDKEVREALWDEIENDLLRMPPASFSEPADVVRRLTSYLHAKLK